MPCTPITMDLGGQPVRAIVCTRRGSRVQRCRWCGARATRLCDGRPNGRSCDAPCCRSCATTIGHEVDLCPECAAGRTEAQIELQLGERAR